MIKPLVAITGASSGIGAAAAHAFSRAGHPLLLTARRVDMLQELNLPDALCRRNDVVDVAEYASMVEEAEERYGPVDLLINNAGYMTLEHVVNQSPADWSRQFEVNVIGLMNATSAVFPAMIARRGGTIMNVGSTAGLNIYTDHVVYCGTKHAVHALSEGLRREAAPHGVRVIVIAPGVVDTELLKNTESEAILRGYADNKKSIGGALSPNDIAAAMLYAYQQPQNVCIWEMVVAPTGQLA